MAQFRATIQGQRGEASRQGSKYSGLTSHANGWDIGGAIELAHVENDGRGRDHIALSLTGGSKRGNALFTLRFSEDTVYNNNLHAMAAELRRVADLLDNK